MQEADTYIKNYKKTYSGIAAYLERAIEDAKEKGYAETLFGRRLEQTVTEDYVLSVVYDAV